MTIYIHRGDSTIFADSKKFLTFYIETGLNLTGWTAKFVLGCITKEITDISSKTFDVVLTAKDTNQLKYGDWHGAIVLTDNEGNIKTVANNILFTVTRDVVENESQIIDLTIPQTSGVDIKLRVGSSGGAVSSVNGMTGDVVIDIPEMPDLTDYVKNTDYATNSTGGVFKSSEYYASRVDSEGFLVGSTKTSTQYNNNLPNSGLLCKGTLENIKDDLVKRALTGNAIELTADDKAITKQLLGYAEPIDIMQAIASIPQFGLSIVDALPETGAKMTLYLVPKEGSDNDVYDEYIWIEQTSSFEHLGTTAVDLTDYVKNTDYASSSKAGVVKTNVSTGVSITSGLLYVVKATDDEITAKTNLYKPIVPNNLDYAVKSGVTTNTIELTDDEKVSARTWLGTISNTDYATGSIAGVIKTSGSFACGATNGYLQTMYMPTLERYNSLSQYAFIGKGTLETVLTQYAKTVVTTEADYEALETKDANTLYLIEE